MTTTATPFVTGKFVENTQTLQYISPDGTRSIIDKCTVINTSASNVTFSANLVAASGTASDANLVIDARAIAVGETYTCPEIVGHILEPNGFISTLAGSASALSLRISGRQITG